MKMRTFVLRTLLIAVGATGFCHLSMAQNTGAAEDVVRQAVSALAANDQPTLTKLSIDQNEFKKYVWPKLATQMSGTNTNADKYYTTFQKVSQVGVTEANTALGGKKWEVVRVDLESVQRKGKDFQRLGPPSVNLGLSGNPLYVVTLRARAAMEHASTKARLGVADEPGLR